MEELEKTINKIDKVMEYFDNLSFFDVYCNRSIPKKEVIIMNDKLHKAYDELFRLNKHLRYIKERDYGD